MLAKHLSQTTRSAVSQPLTPHTSSTPPPTDPTSYPPLWNDSPHHLVIAISYIHASHQNSLPTFEHSMYRVLNLFNHFCQLSSSLLILLPISCAKEEKLSWVARLRKCSTVDTWTTPHDHNSSVKLGCKNALLGSPQGGT